MAWFARAPALDVPPPFAALLPHSLLLDAEAGIVLLATPRWRQPGLALGCAWALEPRNIEVCDENVCLEMARLHESLLHSLPTGGALQGILSIRPTQTAPTWERLRQTVQAHPVVEAQQAALRAGLRHQDGMVASRLRTCTTRLTLRLPIVGLDASVVQRLLLLLGYGSGAALTAVMQQHFVAALEGLDGVRAGIEDALRAAGHTVSRQTGTALGTDLFQALQPLADDVPAILPEVPLGEQVLLTEAARVRGGWTFATADAPPLTAQVLSLHRAPHQTYPGLLSAPRAPEGTRALALWDAWPEYPMTVVVNIAAVDQVTERARLRQKRTLAHLQARNIFGQTSPEHAVLSEELDRLLRQFALSGGQLLWGRVHIVVWGPAASLARASEDVIRAGRRLELELVAEGGLGSTLFLQTLPLGFDPQWPEERVLRRARRLPGANLAQLLPLYGAFRGTATPAVLFMNRRGEAVGFDPFDSTTAPHALVMGTSGSGKSFAMAHLAQQVLPLGASVVILDRLPSYEALCEVWGGDYLAMDFNKPICFNAFYGPLDKAHQAFLTAHLAEMASGGVEPLTREALGVLADAVGYFATTWPAERGEPHLSPFVEEVLKDGGFTQDRIARRLAQELARKLALFYGRGPYAGFTDGPNTLTLDRALTVVELSRLREAPDLQGTLLFALMHLLTQFFADPLRLHQRKYFISDETWALLKHAATAAVLEEIGRTYRKLRTSAIFLSQQGADFDSAAGRVLRANAPATLFLQQDPREVHLVRELFELSPAEVALCDEAVRKHDGWSSAYLRLPGQRGGVVRLVPDPFTRWLSTQVDAELRLREQTVAAAGGDLRLAVQQLARQYPDGLPTGGSR